MKEICIPISRFKEDEIAEVTVKIGDRKENFHFRVESFPWKTGGNEPVNEDEYVIESLKRIYRLKKVLKEYDSQWELIQIFTPSENADHIQVLYRKKNINQQNQQAS